MKKRALTLILAVAMIVGLAAGCAAPTPTAAPATSAPVATSVATAAATPTAAAAKHGALTVSLASSPETIDPTMNSSVDGATYAVHLFEGLLKYKWDGSSGTEPGMAASYTKSTDGLVWTFKLRPDAKWSDGKQVTANDFVYSWRRLVDPATAAPYGLDMGGFIKNGADIVDGKKKPEELGVKAVDATTFEVTLAGPCPFFDEIAAFPVFYPVREDTIKANGDKWIRDPKTFLTNGPYKMESFTTDVSLVVVPNENYYAKDKLGPNKITFMFLADENATLAAYRSGQIQFGDSYPQEELDALRKEGIYGSSAQLGTYYLTYNLKKAPMDNVNVRKALTLAIDTKYIADTLRQGTVLPAKAYVGDGFKDVDQSVEFRSKGQSYMDPAQYEANKTAAKKALADAGYPDGKGFPKLEYMYNDGSGHKMIAEALQQMWKTVLNIDVTLKNQEWNVFQDSRRKGNFQIARNGWLADYYDEASMLNLFLASSGNNDGKFNNPKFEEYMKTAGTTLDRATRIDAMHKAEDVLMAQEWACAPIYYYIDEYIYNKNDLKGWGVSPLGYKFFQGATLASWK